MGRDKLDVLGVSAFLESMAMMSRAGILTEEAVSLLKSKNEKKSGALDQALAVMQPILENGSPLSKAMEETGSFPSYAIRMIEAGESSGRLEATLFRLSAYYKEQKTLNDKIRSATVYPAVMLILVIAVLVVMLTMVLPSFADVYEAMSGSLTTGAAGYLRTAYIVLGVGLGVMAILAAALLAGYLLYKNGKKETVEAVLRKFPVTNDILNTMALFRFTSAFETFLASGKLQDEAVLLSIPMTEYAPLEEKLKAIARKMEEGHGFGTAAYEEELLEPVYGRMLLAGERSGKLEEVLGRINSYLEDHVAVKSDRLVNTVTPLLSGVLMLTVGLALLSVMLPLIGIMNSIG